MAGALLLGLDHGDRVSGVWPRTGCSPRHRPPPARLGARQPCPSPPDLTSMTSREAADRLFDRVMRAVVRE